MKLTEFSIVHFYMQTLREELLLVIIILIID